LPLPCHVVARQQHAIMLRGEVCSQIVAFGAENSFSLWYQS
jgi:hypothetical protein